MLKRLMPFALLVGALALLAAGCGSSSKNASSTTSTTTASTTTAPTTTASTTTAAAGGSSTFKVGLNTDTGGLNDRGFNHLAYAGLVEAQKKLGVQVRVTQSASSSDYIPNLASLARQGYKLVIAVGFTEIQAVEAVAKQYPTTEFAVVDVSNADEGGLKNVEGLLFKEQQVGYLAGYASALAAKARGGDTVSTVGGEKQPPVDRYIAGFEAGAKAAVPGIKTPNAYSQDFANEAKCKEIALNQIAAGSVVVFQVAGGCGLGALDAANEQKVWGVGVDADQSFLGPYVLTSAEKRVDTAVYDAIADAASGHFKGGTDAVYGLKRNGVGLGRFSPKTPAGIPAKVEQIRKEIIAGKIADIPTIVP